MLNESVIRAFRACTKQRKLFDEKGLYLLIVPGGRRLWRFKYRFPARTTGNKEKLISLGSYPEVSLAQARERRDSARRDVANGIDPSLRRTCEKICLGNTFESVAREFISVLRAANVSGESPSSAAADLIQQALKSPRYKRRRSREPISAETVILGLFACLAFKLSGVGNRFPLAEMVGISLGFGGVLVLYYWLAVLTDSSRRRNA